MKRNQQVRSGVFSLLILVLTLCVLSFAVSATPTTEAPQSAAIISGDNQQLPSTATPTRTPTPVSIGNFVWDDLNGNGIQNVGEPGISGITLELWNDTKTLLIDSTTSNGSGNYTLTAPFPDSYHIRAILPAGYGFSPKDQGGDDEDDSDINNIIASPNYGFTDLFTIGSSIISTTIWDVGVIVPRTATPTRTPTPVSIGNFVWDDLNGNGIQNVGEPGISGITLELWNDTKTLLIDSTTSNGSGNYTLTAPFPDSYHIRAILPAGYSFSPKDQGGDDEDDSDINDNIASPNYGFTDLFTIGSSIISTTIWDVGVIVPRTATPTRTPTPVLIGDFVWDDVNGNGIKDGGEAGIGGITLELWNDTRTSLIHTTTSNSSGVYTLIAPFPDSYYVRALLPAGMGFSPKDQGGDDQEDSDINDNIASPNYGFTDLFTIGSSVISTVIWDVGIIDYDPALIPTSTPTLTATATPTGTLLPTSTPPPSATYAAPTAPPTPRCDMRNFVENDILRAGVPIEFDLFCRTLFQYGQPIQYLGTEITSLANVGIEALRNLGLIHAVDIFSPSGQTYFNGGYVVCLQGEGTLIWLDSTNAPRHAEIIGSYTVSEFPGYTCATLFTPGTIIIVEHNPTAP